MVRLLTEEGLALAHLWRWNVDALAAPAMI
jgi:hypothetical protein